MNVLHKTLAVAVLLVVGIAMPPVSAQSVAEDDPLTRAELDQLLAPIALYPDVLLSHVLIASTYPLEVVQAARWSRDNPHLSGEDAVNAVAHMGWDPSVMSLVAFPSLLARMSDDLDWTRRIGDAFLFQEAAVIDAVQGLRALAYDAGHLQSDDYVQVVREERVIYIQPVNPRVVYVPYYNPTVVYGVWAWPLYTPYYWAPPPVYHRRAAFYWTYGVPVSTGFFFTTLNWHSRHIVVVRDYRYLYPPRPTMRRYDVLPRWQHNPAHRRGVVYRYSSLNARYRSPSMVARSPARSSSRSSGLRADALERTLRRGSAPESRFSGARSDPRSGARGELRPGARNDLRSGARGELRQERGNDLRPRARSEEVRERLQQPSRSAARPSTQAPGRGAARSGTRPEAPRDGAAQRTRPQAQGGEPAARPPARLAPTQNSRAQRSNAAAPQQPARPQTNSRAAAPGRQQAQTNRPPANSRPQPQGRLAPATRSPGEARPQAGNRASQTARPQGGNAPRAQGGASQTPRGAGALQGQPRQQGAERRALR